MKLFRKSFIASVIVISASILFLFQNCSKNGFQSYSSKDSNSGFNNQLTENLYDDSSLATSSKEPADVYNTKLANLNDLQLVSKPVKPECPSNFPSSSASVSRLGVPLNFINKDSSNQYQLISITLPSTKDYNLCLDEMLSRQSREMSCGQFNVGGNISCIVAEGGVESELVSKASLNLTMNLGSAIDAIFSTNPSKDPTTLCEAKTCLASYRLPTNRSKPSIANSIKVFNLSAANFIKYDKVFMFSKGSDIYAVNPNDLVDVLTTSPNDVSISKKSFIYPSNNMLSPLKKTAGTCALFDDGTVMCKKTNLTSTYPTANSTRLMDSDPNLINCPYESGTSTSCPDVNGASQFISFSKKVIDISDAFRVDTLTGRDPSYVGGAKSYYKATNMICAVLDDNSIECKGEMIYNINSISNALTITNLKYDTTTNLSFKASHFPYLIFPHHIPYITFITAGGLPWGIYLDPSGMVKDNSGSNAYGTADFVTPSGFLIRNNPEGTSIIWDQNRNKFLNAYKILDYKGAGNFVDGHNCLLTSQAKVICKNVIPPAAQCNPIRSNCNPEFEYQKQLNFIVDLTHYGIN